MTPQDDSASRCLQTARLLIRPYTSDDWRAHQDLAIDYNVSGGQYEGKWPTADEECRKAARALAGMPNYLAACLRDTGALVAMVALNGMDDDLQMDLGYIIHTRYQDGDLDRELLEAMVACIFAQEGARAVVVRWHPDWSAQFAVPTALGFEAVGDKRGEMVLTRQVWEQGLSAG